PRPREAEPRQTPGHRRAGGAARHRTRPAPPALGTGKGFTRVSPRHFRRIIAAGTGVVAAAALAGCASQPRPDVAVRTFLLDWQAGDYASAASFTDGDPGEVAVALKEAHDQLDLAGGRFGLGPLGQDGDTAVSEFEVQADLGIGDPVWKYTGRMEIGRASCRARVEVWGVAETL